MSEDTPQSKDTPQRTEEPIDDDVDEAGLQRLIQLKLRNPRVKSCEVDKRPDGKFLITEWKMFGEE